MSDDTPTQEELAQAEALARALDGEDVHGPEDALEVAALLRYARGAGVASPAQLQRAARAVQPAQPPRRRWIARQLVVGLALAAAAALAYLPATMVMRSPSAEAPVAQHAPAAAPASSAALVAPLRALLDAEALALAQPEAPLTTLVDATARQRQTRLGELTRRYGAQP